jgi:hypothetical protein
MAQPNNERTEVRLARQRFVSSGRVHEIEARARIHKHFKVAVEKVALGKVNFSNGILKQPVH